MLPDFIRPTDLHVGLPDSLDFRTQKLIAFRAGTAPGRIAKLCGMTPIARRAIRKTLQIGSTPKLSRC
jgi:hypothetical protein